MSSYYRRIDSLLAEQTMPSEYADSLSIVLCNDCEVKSEAPYHFLYHKCDQCKGYNTKVIETFKRSSRREAPVVLSTVAVETVPENITSGDGSTTSETPGQQQ